MNDPQEKGWLNSDDGSAEATPDPVAKRLGKARQRTPTNNKQLDTAIRGFEQAKAYAVQPGISDDDRQRALGTARQIGGQLKGFGYEYGEQGGWPYVKPTKAAPYYPRITAQHISSGLPVFSSPPQSQSSSYTPGGDTFRSAAKYLAHLNSSAAQVTQAQQLQQWVAGQNAMTPTEQLQAAHMLQDRNGLSDTITVNAGGQRAPIRLPELSQAQIDQFIAEQAAQDDEERKLAQERAAFEAQDTRSVIRRAAEGAWSPIREGIGAVEDSVGPELDKFLPGGFEQRGKRIVAEERHRQAVEQQDLASELGGLFGGAAKVVGEGYLGGPAGIATVEAMEAKGHGASTVDAIKQGLIAYFGMEAGGHLGDRFAARLARPFGKTGGIAGRTGGYILGPQAVSTLATGEIPDDPRRVGFDFLRALGFSVLGGGMRPADLARVSKIAEMPGVHSQVRAELNNIAKRATDFGRKERAEVRAAPGQPAREGFYKGLRRILGTDLSTNQGASGANELGQYAGPNYTGTPQQSGPSYEEVAAKRLRGPGRGRGLFELIRHYSKPDGLLRQIQRISETGPPVNQEPASSQPRQGIADHSRATNPILEIDGFRLAKHSEMPTPREGKESHHGIMSKWMREHYPRYNPNDAPSVLMTREGHNITRSVYNMWRAEMRQAMGGQFHWSNVSEEEIRYLANRMFERSNTPTAIREGYWRWFERMKTALTREQGH